MLLIFRHQLFPVLLQLFYTGFLKTYILNEIFLALNRETTHLFARQDRHGALKELFLLLLFVKEKPFHGGDFLVLLNGHFFQLFHFSIAKSPGLGQIQIYSIFEISQNCLSLANVSYNGSDDLIDFEFQCFWVIAAGETIQIFADGCVARN